MLRVQPARKSHGSADISHMGIFTYIIYVFNDDGIDDRNGSTRGRGSNNATACQAM